MAAKPIVQLRRYWHQWHPALDQVVQNGNARLGVPELSEKPSTEFAGAWAVSLSHPICIDNAPMKASSTAGAASTKRLTVFVDGCLHIPMEGECRLLHGSCNVSFFRTQPVEDAQSYRGELIDCAHFDMELEDKPSAFHPVLHAQRGMTKNIDACKRALEKADKALTLDRIELDVDKHGDLIKNAALRLPTPQLDIFSLATIVAADYFCSGGNLGKDTGLKERFKRLLELLSGDGNVTREANISRALHERIKKSEHACVSHWYLESLVERA